MKLKDLAKKVGFTVKEYGKVFDIKIRKDFIFRIVAIEKITDQKAIDKIALEEKDTRIRRSAIKKVSNQKILIKIAENDDEHFQNRCVAINNITDRDFLFTYTYKSGLVHAIKDAAKKKLEEIKEIN